MPDWNGLGYIQTAANLSNARAERKQKGWLEMVGIMNKYFETQGAQQYQTGRDKTLQGYVMETQNAADLAASARGAATDKSALERLMTELKSREGEGALDREAQAARDKADAKDKNGKDMLSYLTNAGYQAGPWAIGATGIFSGFSSIVDDETGTRANKIKTLRVAFENEVKGDPKAVQYLAAFDRQAAGTLTEAVNDLVKQTGANKDVATKIVNALRNNPLTGPIADMVLMVFTTSEGGQNIVAAKNWLNRWFPGRLGDIFLPNAPMPPAAGMSRSGAHPSAPPIRRPTEPVPPITNLPRPGTAGNPYRK